MTDESESRLRSVEYDPTTGGYYANHAAGKPASTVVPNAVAEITGRRVEELLPLQHTLDPDALDDLLDAGPVPGRSEPVEISFTYAGFEVTVDSSGVVVLEPLEDEE